MATPGRGTRKPTSSQEPRITIYPSGELGEVRHALEPTEAEAAVRADQGYGAPAREEMKALVRRFVALTNAGRFAELDDVFAHDVVDHDPFPGQAPGLQGMRDAMAAFQAAFPDLRGEAGDLVIDGDRVAFPITFAGTQTGPLMGLEATGRRVRFGGVFLFRVAGGRVVDSWGVPDVLNLLDALGATPWGPDRPIPGVQGDADVY